MTVPSSTAKSGPYLCNGVTDVFNYDFRIVDKAHLNVILADADGVETTLDLATHYTVSDVGSDTGSINLTSAGVALAVTGTTLTILRNPPFTQETDLQNQGAYLAQTVEDRFDLAVMQIQTVKEKVDRAIVIQASDNSTTGKELSADVARLAGSADNIDTVATNVTAVNTTATNIAAVIDAPNQATAAAASATAAATSATNAAGSASNAADSATAALAAVPNVFPADRTALAAIDTANHTVAYLTEAGREGTFLWRGSNLSALVTADTGQVIYIAPASDTTGASGAWVRLHNTGEFLIEWAGGRRNDTTFDNKASHDAAVAALLATGFNVLRFGTGVYTYLSAPAPHTFGVKLVGAGYGSSLDNGATNLERRFNQTNTAHFLKWDGTGIAFNSTGGGIERLNVLAAPGSSGGTAVYLYATSDAQRPGYMEMSHLLVWGTSGGTWALAFVQDGSNCTTASGQGLRDVTFTDVFLSGATVEACQIINGTNNRYNGLYVYPAGGTTAKTRITGLSNAATSKSSNGFGTLFVSGELILDNCNEQMLFGYASSIQITANATNCKFYGDCPTVTFNGLTRYAAANSNNVQVVDKTTLQGTAGASSGTRLSPDGILEAWGTASLTSASAGVAMGVTFGLAPNVQMTVVNASAAYAFLTSVSTTTFNAAASVAGPVAAHWRAIGRAA